MGLPLNSGATQGQFQTVGVAGALLGLLVCFVLFLAAPALAPLAFLDPAVLSSPLFAVSYLLVLGLIVVVEWPVLMVAMFRMARSAVPAWMLLALHGAYAFVPAFYAALGVIPTGEQWWVLVMAVVIGLRVSASWAAIDPPAMAALAARKRQSAATVEVTDSSPSVGGSPTVGVDDNSPVEPVETGLVTPQAGNTNRVRIFGTSAPENSKPERTLADVRGYVLDMDGVLYRGKTIRAGAVEFTRILNRRNIPYVCVSNNASHSREQYAAKLAQLGLPIPADRVIGAAQATAEWLTTTAVPGARVLVVGGNGLVTELERSGFTIVTQPPADYVVVGEDLGLTYEKLKQATLALRQRAIFIGTNPDKTLPGEGDEGLVPGNGAQLAYLEAATGKTATIVGKPERGMMEIALAHLGLPASALAIIGDRLDTDILGGQNVGMLTILLRGGVTSASDLATSPIQPDLIFDDLSYVVDAMERTG